MPLLKQLKLHRLTFNKKQDWPVSLAATWKTARIHLRREDNEWSCAKCLPIFCKSPKKKSHQKLKKPVQFVSGEKCLWRQWYLHSSSNRSELEVIYLQISWMCVCRWLSLQSNLVTTEKSWNGDTCIWVLAAEHDLLKTFHGSLPP